MATAIKADGLGREYREPRRLFQRQSSAASVALSDVSFSVKQGECVALTGPNGAGKSTLLRVLATLITATSGTAQVAGFDIERERDQVRSSIGFVMNDDRSFFWPLTGLENLVFFGELQGLRTADARDSAGNLLERVDLADVAVQRVSGYSSGMRQLLGIARALLHHPAVLLMDEPTASLDLNHRSKVIDIIAEIASGGNTTVLVATHDAGLVASAADRTIHLDRGGIVPETTPRAATRYRVTVGGMDQQRAAMIGKVIEASPEGVSVLRIDDLGDGHALSAAIANVVADGGEIRTIETFQPSPRPR